MESLSAEDLWIAATDAGPGGTLSFHWTGKSVDRQPGRTLGPYFAKALGRAVELSASVEMHFEELEYLNSSTVTGLVQLIRDARAAKVNLVFVYDQRLRWQKLAFEALAVLGKPTDDLFRLRSI
jgi:hypothetical protein